MTTPEEFEHRPGEAVPAEVPFPAPPAPARFGLQDSDWTETQWLALLNNLIEKGVATWKDVTALVLGHLNPSQVGTSLASSDGFRRKYGKGNTMRIVMDWAYSQTGRCADCGTRLELQADHMKGREEYDDPLDADFIENMTLRCRRCNVIRRPSHEFGGLTYLTAEAALMWILLVIRPRTYLDYIRLCRLYGMTMSDIRMAEAWAMAHWLSRSNPPAYGIEDDQNSRYDLVLWPDSAVTRIETGSEVRGEGMKLHTGVSGSSIFGFITTQADGRLRFHEQAVSFIPFSTYDLDDREPQALCIRYSPPDRKNGRPQELQALPPRGATVLCHSVRTLRQRFLLSSLDNGGGDSEALVGAPYYGRFHATNIAHGKCRIVAEEIPA